MGAEANETGMRGICGEIEEEGGWRVRLAKWIK